MLIKCKCGNALTKDLTKTTYKDAYVQIQEDKYVVKAGTYHRWEKKWSSEDYNNVYVISEEDFVGAQRYNAQKGCCRFDYYEIKCNCCSEKVGYGQNDCWQDSAAYLFTMKTKIVNK